MSKEQKEFAEEIKKELIELRSLDNEELAHQNADSLLCQLLYNLGFKDVVEEFEKIHKEYC